MVEDTKASKAAYAAAVREIARVIKAGETQLKLDDKKFNALTRIPPNLHDIKGLYWVDLDNTQINDLTPLQVLTGLQQLLLNQTGVVDLTPLQALTGLQGLYLNQTGVVDLTPLQALTGLQRLLLDQTGVVDLTPLQALTGLQRLSLNQTGVVDLRPICDLPLSGKGPFSGISFANTPAIARDPELLRLSAVEDNEQRTRETLAYLKTLPKWPEPLPWLVQDSVVTDAPPPAPDPALPMRNSADGITLVTLQITEAELDDPIRSTLHAALQDQVNDLIRVAGNTNEAAYLQACKLRDLLEVGLAQMNPLLVHLAIEALRRINASAQPNDDKDYLLALGAVIDTGPGLTLDTKQVQLFVDRARRNRLDRMAMEDAEAQIRIARNIAISDLSAPDLKSLAERAADIAADDQFTAIRPTLGRNYVIELSVFLVAQSVVGVIGNEAHQAWETYKAWEWLAANGADIRVLLAAWGEPFAAWIAPILDRSHQMVEAAKQLGSKMRSRP